jgi:hypothetical protein
MICPGAGGLCPLDVRVRDFLRKTALTSTPDIYVSATYRGTSRLVKLTMSKGFYCFHPQTSLRTHEGHVPQHTQALPVGAYHKVLGRIKARSSDQGFGALPPKSEI